MSEHSAEIDALRAAGYHVMRQGTWDNHTRELSVLRNENRWLRDEKEHHEKWLSGILDESRRLQDRFNRITAAMAVSGVKWSVIADLLGDETRVTPPAECRACRVLACEVEGNTADPHTCVIPPGRGAVS